MQNHYLLLKSAHTVTPYNNPAGKLLTLAVAPSNPSLIYLAGTPSTHVLVLGPE